MKLNLGCGDERLEGYVNCDLFVDGVDQRVDARSLPYPDGTIDEIRAYHLIEHFKFKEAFDVIHEWHRALKPGGLLVLETPDLLNTCRRFVAADNQGQISLYGHLFAAPGDVPGQVHYFLYTETQLAWTLEQCGFDCIQRLPPDSTYAQSVHVEWPDIYLKMMARKCV